MDENIKERIKYWMQLFLLPVYGLSFLVPRNKKIWLFGSSFGKRWADNPRYLYLYVNQNCKNKIRPIWISHNREIVHMLTIKGYEAYYNRSIKGMWLSLRGKVYLYDNYSKDISFWLSGGATKINLWHGVGNKKTNHDNKHDKIRHPKNRKEEIATLLRRISDEKPHHYTLATSPVMAKIFASAFKTTIDHIIIDGLPRNDIMFKDCKIDNISTKEEILLLAKITKWKKQGKQIALYAPTFRPSEHRFLEIMKMNKFAEFLEENNLIFIAKLHPKSQFLQEFKKLTYESICVPKADVDMNCILGQADLLITDYSSVYSDYMLLGRPVVAFQYDYEDYTRDTRDAYFDFNEYMPEVKAKTMEELEKAMLQVLEVDKCSEAREVSRKVIFKYKDGRACERLVKKIYKNN